MVRALVRPGGLDDEQDELCFGTSPALAEYGFMPACPCLGVLPVASTRRAAQHRTEHQL